MCKSCRSIFLTEKEFLCYTNKMVEPYCLIRAVPNPYADGHCLEMFPHLFMSLEQAEEVRRGLADPVLRETYVAQKMKDSPFGYMVEKAKERIAQQQDCRELGEKVRSGELTMDEALKSLNNTK